MSDSQLSQQLIQRFVWLINESKRLEFIDRGVPSRELLSVANRILEGEEPALHQQEVAARREAERIRDPYQREAALARMGA